jgi:histidinol-phosphate aminotransferase
VNAIAQAGAVAALQDDEHVEQTRAVNAEGLAFYEEAFTKRGLEYVPSVANFILVNVGDGDRVFKDMLKKGVIVRAMRGYKLPDWVRISIGTADQNARCLEVLDSVLSPVAV